MRGWRARTEGTTDFHLELGISRSLHNEIVQVLSRSKSLQASLFVKGGLGEIETVISVHIAHCCVDAALSVASRPEPTGQGALPKSEPLVHLPDTPQPG